MNAEFLLSLVFENRFILTCSLYRSVAARRGRQGRHSLPKIFEVKMGGRRGFNVNKIHNSFQFMSQNVYFLFVISQL